jgi:hypothetical protein
LGTVTTGTWNSIVGSSATFAAGLSGANLASITGGNVSGQVANALVAGTVYTAAQPNITSVGTLTGLGVNGTVTAVNITANTGVFTGNGSGLSAIAGANVTGTVSSATTAGTVTTAAQPNITSVGTLSSLAVTGNASAGNLNTAGAVVASTLTSNVATGTAPLTVSSTTRVANLNVAYANVTDHINVTTQSSGNAYLLFGNALTGNIAETANATFVANTSNGALYATTFVGALSGAATSATTAGTVTTAAQPNITSVGTLSSLGVNGTVTAVAFTANTGVFTGNANGLSSVQAGNIVGTTLSSTVVTSSLTTVGTLGSLGVSGNITAANITANTGIFAGNGSGLTALNASNISTGTLAQARLANASVTLGSTALTLGSTVTTVAGLSSVTSTTFVGTLSGAATTAGTVTTAAQPNITSVGTLSGLTVSSTISGSVSGSAATVTTAAQPNITSVGTLTSLTVSGAANIQSTTAATSTTTGALIVAGGIGANANSYFSNFSVKSNIAYVSPNGANTINSQMLNGGTLAWSGNAGQLFSITDSMSGNIFSVNDVSGIPMITVSDTGTINLAPSGGFVAFGVSTGISAAGSTQGTATALTRPINVVSTVSSGQGVVMPTTTAGMRIVIINTSATALNVYPATGGAINAGATNAAYSLAAGGRLEFVATSTTQWYTLSATYA